VKRRVLIAAFALISLLAILVAFVATSIDADLDRVRDRLDKASVSDLDEADVEEIRADVDSVLDRIHSIPGRIVGLLPVLSSNLDAVEDVADSLVPVLASGLDLRAAAEDLEDGGVLENGRIQIDAIEALKEPLEHEIAALEELETAAQEGRSGWNLPNVWDSLSALSVRIGDIRDDAEALNSLLDQMDGLLGAKGKRTYLVMLLNNSELRGGGGVMTGVGTISVDNGELDLGKFESVHDVRGEKIVEVKAPATYERRYAKYLANTSLFVNTAYSPDIPDDALVASRAYEKVTGTSTDGAIVADPRGIAALLPDNAEIPVPNSERVLSKDEIPGFTYSGAYESFDSQDDRRAALIGVGEAAFEVAIDEGLRGREVLLDAGRAVAAGHLRVVSFDDEEEEALTAVGASGDLPTPESDGLLVVAQNRGDPTGQGNKLDYWIERDVGHQCKVTAEKASCVTATTLTNEADKGLTRYAAGRPYAVLRTYLETYVPAGATVTGFEIDDESAPYITEAHEGWTSVASDVEISRTESATIEVAYDIALNDSYALTAAPQPLARDAAVDIALRLPKDWIIRGPGRREDEIFRYKGPMDEQLSISAEPDERSGLPALWQTLVRFWREPLF
jgi:Protein of unknown function (DUF4012)